MRGLHSSITKPMLPSSCGLSAMSEPSPPRLSRGSRVGLTVGIGDQDDRDGLSCWHGRWNDGYSDGNDQKNGVKEAGDRIDEFGHFYFS